MVVAAEAAVAAVVAAAEAAVAEEVAAEAEAHRRTGT